MNKTILQGKWRQTRGSLKTRWGEIADDDRRMLDGKIDQMVGLIQERYGYTQERATHALKHYLKGYGQHRRWPAAGAMQPRRLALVMVGMIALRPATTVSAARPTSNSDPMIERERNVSPTFARPRACSVARFAELPVPQGERSTRPGHMVVAVRTRPSGSRSRNIT